MKIQYAKNPIWVNQEQTLIDLIIKWEDVERELPFTASASDVEQHGKELFAAALRGEFGEIFPYVPPEPNPTYYPILSRRQLRLGLLKLGVTTTQVDSVISNFPEPERSVALIEWQDATGYQRNHPLVHKMTEVLRLDETVVNQTWLEASIL
jgi:hypothetical protein